MSTHRTFILREPTHAASLVAFLKEHAGEAARRGRPLQVVVSEHRPKRSTSANAGYWGYVLQPISEQVTTDGEHHSPEAFHEYAKRQCLPDMTASGVHKWRVLPGGNERILTMSTSDLNDQEFDDYAERVRALFAGEFGVEFPVRDND